MGAFSRVSRVLVVADGSHYGFFCAACDSPHIIPTGPGQQGWHFDGNLAQPTFSPSILVRSGSAVEPNFADEPGDPPRVCHSFVRGGQIQYLSDCDHHLAGQTVPLADWPATLWDVSNPGEVFE